MIFEHGRPAEVQIEAIAQYRSHNGSVLYDGDGLSAGIFAFSLQFEVILARIIRKFRVVRELSFELQIHVLHRANFSSTIFAYNREEVKVNMPSVM